MYLIKILFILLILVLINNIYTYSNLTFKLEDNLGIPSSFNEPVDFLIPWSGITHNYIDDSLKKNKKRYLYNNELFYCILCIINNANWYNKIIVLLDIKEDLYSIINKNICEKYNIIPIERQQYFSKDNYPTMNSHAVETIFHKIKELNEYFIYIDDDILITNKVEKGHFFTNNKPVIIFSHLFSNNHKYYLKKKKFIGKKIYKNESVFREKTPLTFGIYAHLPAPLKKTHLIKFAEEYKDWYNFVQSHKIRFSSTNSNYLWKLEEDMKGIWTYDLYKNNEGVLKLVNRFSKKILIEYQKTITTKNIYNYIKKYNTLFVNVNDPLSLNELKEITKNLKKF